MNVNYWFCNIIQFALKRFIIDIITIRSYDYFIYSIPQVIKTSTSSASCFSFYFSPVLRPYKRGVMSCPKIRFK